MKRVFALIILVLSLSGCGAISFPQLNAPKPPEQVYKYHQTITTEPRVVQTNDKGQSVVFTAQTQTVDVNYDRKDKPLSWWQRFCNWLGNIGMLGLVGLIVALVIAPGGTMLWLWKQYMKFKKAFTQTVDAIDESKAVQTNVNLKTALSAKQDNDVKALVDDLQQPGK